MVVMILKSSKRGKLTPGNKTESQTVEGDSLDKKHLLEKC
jgi:hypothetical protein